MFRLTEHALLCLTERIHVLPSLPLRDRAANPVKRHPPLLRLTERIHALLDRFAIPVERDPL